MKRTPALFNTIIAIVAISMVFVPSIGATSSEDLKEEMHEAWEAFKSYMADQKHKAVEHGKDLLQKADAEIEVLENNAAKASDDTKTWYREEINKLKQKRANAAEKLDELENSTSDSWDATKEGFVKAYEDLYDAYREAVAKFN